MMVANRQDIHSQEELIVTVEQLGEVPKTSKL